jgi:glucokinase
VTSEPGRWVPVIEVGGTHVVAALVNPADWALNATLRRDLDADAPAADILDVFVDAGRALAISSPAVWGVAMPDPFDYGRGVATFRDVGKFDALYGVDVGAALRERLPGPPAEVRFVNDADAFILGEWLAGAAAGFGRCVGITLGSGIGSGWVVDGTIRHDQPGVPPDGRARHFVVDGRLLEDCVSRRAVRRAYAAAGGDDADVLEITQRCRAGEATAEAVLRRCFTDLGRGFREPLREFRTEVIVVGGSMAGSWDLFDPWFRDGLDWPDAPPVRLAALADAALVGAARIAAQ